MIFLFWVRRKYIYILMFLPIQKSKWTWASHWFQGYAYQITTINTTDEEKTGPHLKTRIKQAPIDQISYSQIFSQ